MKPIAINIAKPALEFFDATGNATRWEYSVILIRLAIEELQGIHKLPKGEKLLAQPTAPFLIDLAERIKAMGAPDCDADLALRIYSLNSIEFRQLSGSITNQVTELLKG